MDAVGLYRHLNKVDCVCPSTFSEEEYLIVVVPVGLENIIARPCVEGYEPKWDTLFTVGPEVVDRNSFCQGYNS